VNAQRNIIITGCSSGIGFCVAKGLKERGYRVFATARRQQDVKELNKQGFESYQLDLTNSQSINIAVGNILDIAEGRIYGLFNNAGYGQPGAVEDLSRDSLRQQFEVNLFGAHELTSLIIPVMRAQGVGRIIQNSSILGLISLKYRGAYNASKYALEGLTDALRMELKGTGISVSLIEPGPIKSNFRENAYKAFKKNIDVENSAHRNTYKAVLKRLQSNDNKVPFTLGPEAVFEKVIHALESKLPKNRYYITVPSYGFAFMKRILPGPILDWLLIKTSDAENK